ncbi:MAG: M3 family metallopeptidase [Vicinamibacteraceae bacterium]|nr:M3 family metallopeptidase [Vicinamibacteraceae bacterium]
MKRVVAVFIGLALLAGAPGSAQTPKPVTAGPNPLLEPWTTPFGVPPFAQIRTEHFLPAITEGIARQRAEVEAIASNPAAPTFANTIAAMEHAGEVLSRVTSVFSNLQSAETTPELQRINREVAPLLTALRDDIRMNPTLFGRVKAVWEGRAQAGLTPEQEKLLGDTYREFVRGGAALDAESKTRLRELNAELAMLGIKFGDNLLHDTNAYRLVIERAGDLAGLPPSVVAMGAEAAAKAGLEGKWVYTLHAPSIWPFLQYADNRELRRQIFTAYTTRNDHGDEYDNKAIAAKIAALRVERARLLGYETHAHFVIDENMAKTPGAVTDLLSRLWTPTRERLLEEAAAQQALIDKEPAPFALAAWDWFYYTEKVQKARFDLDEQAVRPYFALDRVREGAFHVAGRLFGLTFVPRPDLPVYHPEVKGFEVKDADGSTLAIFYTDYHPRPGKRGGAWSSTFRSTRLVDGARVVPIVTNVCNFSRPTAAEPALLTRDEVQTLFHEFGHALASMLSRVEFRGQGRYPRDFVELPSQIMENWAFEPEVLAVYAKHFATGETIPMTLVRKLQEADTFNQGFLTGEYLAAAILDMDWHLLTASEAREVDAFEQASMRRIDLPSFMVPRYRTPYFNHIFGGLGGYSAGYYNYIWADVIVADAFQLFKEKGIFDPATAASLRKDILERGGSEDAMTLYKRFRGREPGIEPLLVKRGLKKPGT